LQITMQRNKYQSAITTSILLTRTGGPDAN
jgi:hypothetical protein